MELPNGHGISLEDLSFWTYEEIIGINTSSPTYHVIRTKGNLFLRDNMGAEESYW